MARPQNTFAYEDGLPLARLAAEYAFGIARNHPFVDGNKRTAFVTCLLFLRLNGKDIDATQEEKYEAFMQLAAGELHAGDFRKRLAGQHVSYEKRSSTYETLSSE